MQCVAYSYCPINTERRDRIPFLHSQDNNPGFIYMELPYEPLLPSPPVAVSGDTLSHRDKDTAGPTKNVPTISFSVTSESTLSHSLDSTLVRRRPTRYRKDEHKDFIVEAPFDKETEVELYRNLIKGQIFLSLVTYQQSPKLVS
jgi:hypothetical protein